MLICKECFADEELRSEVSNKAAVSGVCGICGVNASVMDSSKFTSFFEALLSLFEPSSESDRTAVDIIQDEWRVFKDKDTARRLLDETIQSQGLPFGIDVKVDYTSTIRERVGIWDRLKSSVREKSRFFTQAEDLYNYLSAENVLEIGKELYRSRIIPAGEKSIEAENMGCPPKEKATAGRANPVGIPYLYLSDAPKTTYYEVRAIYLDRLSVGTFEIMETQKLVDFNYDVSLFLSYSDENRRLEEDVIRKKVVEAIGADLSKPLRRYDSELEYVPTQFICEYCKEYIGADGVSFESSLYKGGRNYVLFNPSAAKCKSTQSCEITRVEIEA